MIGSNSIILLGIEIGNHVIVATGSIVTKNIPDGMIVRGYNQAHRSYLNFTKKRNKVSDYLWMI